MNNNLDSVNGNFELALARTLGFGSEQRRQKVSGERDCNDKMSRCQRLLIPLMNLITTDTCAARSTFCEAIVSAEQ